MLKQNAFFRFFISRSYRRGFVTESAVTDDYSRRLTVGHISVGLLELTAHSAAV
jgi:hypothetical protein